MGDQSRGVDDLQGVFIILQGGQVVARAVGPLLQSMAEINGYAEQYAEDGYLEVYQLCFAKGTPNVE